MKLYNPKHGCVLAGFPRRGSGEGGRSPGVELSCVAPGCVRVLACDMVRGANSLPGTFGASPAGFSVFCQRLLSQKGTRRSNEQQATGFHSSSGFIRWSQSQWDVGFEVIATGYFAFLKIWT